MQAVFWTDFIALTAEDTLGYPDSYPLGIGKKLYSVSWTDPDAHLTPDTGVPVILNLPS